MGLLSLPAEVLGMICGEFCLHCKKAGSDRRFYFEIDTMYFPPDNTTLVALLQTCKLLHSIAEPYLYHRPVASEFFRLTYVLLQRPHLGQFVKQISVTRSVSEVMHEPLTPGHIECIGEFIESCSHMEDTTLYQVARRYEWLPLPKSMAKHFHLPELMFDDEYDTLFITIVLSMTPSLKKLEIGLWDYWKFPWCRPNSLLCLRELTITQWWTPEGSSTDDLSGLLAAAPGLERLEFVRVGQGSYDRSKSNKPYLHHANVREITCKSCDIPTQNLEALMDGFPNLQMFHYGHKHWVREVRITRKPFSRAMGQVVMLRQDTLRHLSLQLSRLCCEDMAGERLQDLSGMAALETLHVDYTSLHRQPNTTFKVGLTICELLPSSIREFGLMGETQEHLYEEVLELITTSNRAFPHLRKVIVTSCVQENGYLDSEASSLDDDSSDDDRLDDGRSDWTDRFSSACRKHNIEFSTEKPRGWDGLSTTQRRYEWNRGW